MQDFGVNNLPVRHRTDQSVSIALDEASDSWPWYLEILCPLTSLVQTVIQQAFLFISKRKFWIQSQYSDAKSWDTLRKRTSLALIHDNVKQTTMFCYTGSL
ncbi:hypothetical protein M758_UG208700 [Ceratodon purpureus]|nr:hypothetical protein M758_UG208700 [Ceratodon purpureus]